MYLAKAYGGVVVNDEGQVLLREPTSHYDGYVWTFAKGRASSSETPEQVALREVCEETGYESRILCEIPGSFPGGTTENCYFLMQAVRQVRKPDWETQSLRWVGFDEAVTLVGQSTNSLGRQRDLDVLAAARQCLEEKADS